jgi:hypothetical protein
MGKEIKYNHLEKIGNCIYIEEAFYKGKKRYALFQCECGNRFNAVIYEVKSLHTRSCGCIHSKQVAERNFRHGLAKTVEHTLWNNMKQRCNNPNFKNYHLWGGRGIKVCDRWLESFENFLEDMGKQPAKRMGIDRIDNNKGYSPENCRWASHKTQNNNKRNNKIIEYNGKSQTLMMWCEELGLKYGVMLRRFLRGGKTTEEIFTVKKYNTHGSPICQ